MKTNSQITQLYPETQPEDWYQHPNGGGWVHRDAKVSPKAYLSKKAVARGGTIRGGTIWGGTILGGTILGGAILGGTIEGGTILGGTIESGTILGGAILGGTIRGGTIWGGTIEGGTILGGTIKGGTIKGGTIEGGTIEGGTIRGGTIRGGAILGGTWTHAPLFVVGSRYPATNAKPGHIKIGCRCEPFAWWLSSEAEEFARKNGYDDAAIEEYRKIVQLLVAIGK